MTEEPPVDEQLADELRTRRPAPRREFDVALRQRLSALEAQSRRPEHLKEMVVAYACSGALLLILAALGASGSGPFG
jgi:hypothetical protein